MTLQVGIKQMLRLIWSKDNSSMSEDGKEFKGVGSRLLGCYCSLYFDPLTWNPSSRSTEEQRI